MGDRYFVLGSAQDHIHRGQGPNLLPGGGRLYCACHARLRMAIPYLDLPHNEIVDLDATQLSK